jgi:hypothetical protein
MGTIDSVKVVYSTSPTGFARIINPRQLITFFLAYYVYYTDICSLIIYYKKKLE